ncbi:FG-GAP repeat domain-containing protein [Streptomyces sp. NBC_01451]|uniref:FG-GAP repeat domain-containing protein n=1 Tax=Streptomyces sp. NBC_01451 TaxID=2903872 RepID=UPI002E2FC08D|nr:VCBS repeat-containing protein [Streptomyces sp. NBC_01451]
MGRHAPRRGGPTALVSAFMVALAAGTITLFAATPDGGGAAQAATASGTTAAAGTAEIVLDDPNSTTPRTERLLGAGESGFLHRQADVAGLLWTKYTDGTTVTVQGPSGAYQPDRATGCYDITLACPSGLFAQAGDIVAMPPRSPGDPAVLWSPDGSALRTADLPYGDYIGTYGSTVVARDNDRSAMELIDFVDGEQRDRTVTGLTGDEYRRYEFGSTGDQAGAVLAYAVFQDDHTRRSTIGYLDFATAEFTVAFTGADDFPEVVLTEDRIGWYTPASGLHLKPRADLTAEETVPVAGNPDTGEVVDVSAPVLLGDWLVLTDPNGGSTAVSLADGSTRTLLDSTYGNPLAAPDGSALVTGGTGPADWWIQRITEGPDGAPQLTKLYKVAPYENAKSGVALSRGHLRVAENTSGDDTTSVRTLTTDNGTTLTASAAKSGQTVNPICPYAGTVCSVLWGNHGAEPEDVFLQRTGGGKERLMSINEEWGNSTLAFGTGGGAIVDVSDNYVVYNSGGTAPAQYVGEFVQGQKLKRTIRAAALNGSTLWSATGTSGQLTSYSLTANKVLATVTVPGLGCVPSELQAAGRWVYWACGTASAGVYDTKARKSTAVKPGDVLLGDGFTVRHDHATDELVLTRTPTGTTRVLASRVPDTGLAADRRYRWTVDEYTGLVAWFDEYEQTHVATTGVAPSTPTAFANVIENSLVEPPTASSYPWQGSWLLSRPVTSWSLTFTSEQSAATGRLTRTFTGGAARAWLSASWNGRTANGTYFPNGEFAWTLKATGLGTSAPVTVVAGTGFTGRGSAVRHDFTSLDGPDGRGDLLTLSNSGALAFHDGTGRGGISRDNGENTGTGWPASVTAVAFGDLSGDRCNDVLVRMATGALRLYKPRCGYPVTPSTSYTTLATSGWTQYDILTSPGDVSGDGRPDLIARKASTGTVHLYKGTSAGKLSAPVTLYADWKGYKKIVGAGDLDGDGIGDLLAQDKADNLYRFNGTGRGTFTARTKLFGSWGASYNAVVGVGDLNDDGRADLVARDTAGNLYRQSGDGKGSFGARAKIGSGWGGYKSLS